MLKEPERCIKLCNLILAERKGNNKATTTLEQIAKGSLLSSSKHHLKGSAKKPLV